MRRLATVLTLLICSVAALSGCGNDEPDTSAEPEETSSPAEPEETSSPADDDDTATIEITISNGSVSPNGERVEIDAGQPIELIVMADEAGEIHVHSTREQEYAIANQEAQRCRGMILRQTPPKTTQPRSGARRSRATR